MEVRESFDLGWKSARLYNKKRRSFVMRRFLVSFALLFVAEFLLQDLFDLPSQSRRFF